MIAQANTNYLDRPVFGGTTAGAVAYDPDGSLRGRRRPDHADGRRRTPRCGWTRPARRRSARATPRLFTVLKSISDSIRSGDTAKLTDDLKNLDKAGDHR